MHLTVTAVSSEEAFHQLALFSNALESAINPLIALESYGTIGRLMIVIVAVYASQEENLAFCKAHNKVGTYTHPVTKERVKFCSLAIPFCFEEIVRLPASELRKKLISEILAVMENPTPKMPKGFEYSRLANRLSLPLEIFARAE